MKQQGK